MVHCSSLFHSQIHNKDFLVILYKLIEFPNKVEQLYPKITYLIQKWANRFSSQKDNFPLFFEIYNGLINKRVSFPDNNQNVFSFTNFSKFVQILKDDNFREESRLIRIP